MKQTKNDKRVFGVLHAALVVAVAAIVGVVWAVWYDLNIGFGAPAHPDFKGYTTALALNGQSLQGAELIRYTEYGLEYWWFTYVLSYDSAVTVQQRSAGLYPEGVANCKSRAKGAYGEYYHTCDVFSTQSGGRYMILQNSYKGELSSITVEAIIGTTKFDIAIPRDKVNAFANYDGWQAYFDSLQPVSLETMPFTVTTHAGSGV